MLSRLFSIVLPFVTVFLLWSAPTSAQDPSSGIQSTINGQISAFQMDDFEQAFSFASPSIQRMFGTASNFGTMVRNGYPMVWRPRSYQFADLREISGVLWQMVLFQDQSGALHALDYRMIQVDGVWRISGVQILPAPDLSV